MDLIEKFMQTNKLIKLYYIIKEHGLKQTYKLIFKYNHTIDDIFWIILHNSRCSLIQIIRINNHRLNYSVNKAIALINKTPFTLKEFIKLTHNYGQAKWTIELKLYK